MSTQNFILSAIRDAYRSSELNVVRKYNSVVYVTVRITRDIPELFVKSNVLDARMTLEQLIRFLDFTDPNK